MKLRNWAKASAALVAGAAIALAIPALPAVGAQSPPQPAIHLVSARIADRGAVAFVTVHFVCPDGNSASVSVQLTERSGNGIAQGYGNSTGSPVCEGSSQSLTLPVTASEKPFVVGSAFGQAELESCVPNIFCTSASSTKSIKIAKS